MEKIIFRLTAFWTAINRIKNILSNFSKLTKKTTIIIKKTIG